MSSIVWNDRTVLDSESTPGLSTDKREDEKITKLSRTRLRTVHLWVYLASLGESGNLQHFRPVDFKLDELITPLGSGATYSVDRRTLVAIPSDKAPTVVAVKKLNIFRDHGARAVLGSAGLERSIETVLKELRILTHASLRSHRNIVSLVGYQTGGIGSADSPSQTGRVGAEVILVMEYAPFGTLQEFLLDKAKGEVADGESTQELDLEMKAHLMHDVATGLGVLHDCKIAHGDVKLENVLVFPSALRSYTAKLSDFGHALIDTREVDRRKRYLGTPILNAPEVRRQGGLGATIPLPLDPDTWYQCDVYSYGLLIWEVLLDGRRFIVELDDLIPDGGDDVLLTLNTMPKNELLLRAISTLSTRYGKSKSPLVPLLSRVLRGTLRDNPQERKTIKIILDIFREQGAFYGDAILGKWNKGSSEKRAFPEPLPSDTRPTWEASGRLLRKPQWDMPMIVQQDLLAELQSEAELISSPVRRRTGLYHLALSTITGLGGHSVDLEGGLRIMNDAAHLGCPEAVVTTFRLHAYLGKQLPETLVQSRCPVVELEQSLAHLDSNDYFAEHVRLYERIRREELLGQQFDICHGEERILGDILLSEVQNMLLEMGHFQPELLTCVPSQRLDGLPTGSESLLALAARVGRAPLVRALLAESPTSTVDSLPLDRFTPLKAAAFQALLGACRSGNLEILEVITAAGFRPTPWNFKDVTPLHWLIIFAPEERSSALSLLTSTVAEEACLQSKVPKPGVDMGAYSLWGTPLEFAITVNCRHLVELFLGEKLKSDRDADLSKRGWTEDTFAIAASLSHWNLLPTLIPLEIAYRRSRPTFAVEARFRRSKGENEVPPFGLIDIVYPHDPLLPMIMRGASTREALETTIDMVLQAGVCTTNHEDANGWTALSHAIRFAPCDVSTDIIDALISRGAQLGSKDDFRQTLASVGKWRGSTARPIVERLLGSGRLPLTMELLSSAVTAGNAPVVEAILCAEQDGKRLNVNDPGIENGVAVPVIFLALPFPNNSETVRVLLDHGADLDVRWVDQDISPLQAAVLGQNRDGETIDLLISRGAPLMSGKVSILDYAAMISESQVDGRQVLVHLLKHDRIKELLASGMTWGPTELDRGISPLVSACAAATSDGVHALFQAGVMPRTDQGWRGVLNMVVSMGRRPHESPFWDKRRRLVGPDPVYGWRRRMEEIILTILERSEPGHGRTRVHVAAMLWDHRRVVELVEQKGCGIVADGKGLLPGAYLDMAFPTPDAEDEERADDEMDELILADLERAREYLRAQTLQALVGMKPTLGHEHPNSFSPQAELADCLAKQERWVEAGILQDQILDRKTRTLGPHHHETLGVKISLGKSLREQGDLPESETCGREVFASCKAHLGDGAVLTLEALDELGKTLMLGGKREEALELHQERVEILTKLRGEIHHESRYAFEVLATTLFTLGRMEEAEEAAARCLEITKAISESNGTLMSHASHYLGVCKQANGRLHEAKELYRQAIYQERAFHKGEVGESLISILQLARLHMAEEEWEDAEKLLEEIVSTRPRTTQATVLETVRLAESHLGYIRENDDRMDEAIEHFHRAMDLSRSLYGDAHDYTAQSITDIVRVYEAAGRYWDSYTLSAEVLRYKQRKLGEYHENTVAAKIDMAFVYTDLGMWRSGEELLSDILRHMQSRDASEQEPQDMKVIIEMLAQCCTEQGRFRDAEKYARNALEYQVKETGPDDERTIKLEIDLGYILASGGKHSEAEALSLDILKRAGKLSSDENHNLNVSAQSLRSHVLYHQGRYAEAMPLQRSIVSHRPNNHAELRCLKRLCVKTALYEEALEIAKKLLAMAEAASDAGNPSNAGIVDALTNIARLHVAMGKVTDGMEAGERARNLLDKKMVKGVYDHNYEHLQLLRVLREIYAEVGEEAKLLDVELWIPDIEKQLEEGKEAHLRQLRLDEMLFEHITDKGPATSAGSGID